MPFLMNQVTRMQIKPLSINRQMQIAIASTCKMETARTGVGGTATSAMAMVAMVMATVVVTAMVAAAIITQLITAVVVDTAIISAGVFTILTIFIELLP